MPEGAIVSDEARTSGLFNPGATVGAPAHAWLCLTGGAIGQGLPIATGAASPRPTGRWSRSEADGSALYTIQSLWTQAREGLDVTTIIYNNRSYAVLNMELGAGRRDAGGRRPAMLDLHHPDIDFVAMARAWACPPPAPPRARTSSTSYGLARQRGPHHHRGHRPLHPLTTRGYGRRHDRDVLDGVLDDAGRSSTTPSTCGGASTSSPSSASTCR